MAKKKENQEADFHTTVIYLDPTIFLFYFEQYSSQ